MIIKPRIDTYEAVMAEVLAAYPDMMKELRRYNFVSILLFVMDTLEESAKQDSRLYYTYINNYFFGSVRR